MPVFNNQFFPSQGNTIASMTGALGATNLDASNLAGQYRVCYHLVCSGVVVGTDTVSVTVTWRGPGGVAVNVTSAVITLNNANGTVYAQGVLYVKHSALAGASIQFSTTFVGAAGDSYQLYVTQQLLGPL
jgi:hypothetical protein